MSETSGYLSAASRNISPIRDMQPTWRLASRDSTSDDLSSSDGFSDHEQSLNRQRARRTNRQRMDIASARSTPLSPSDDDRLSDGPAASVHPATFRTAAGDRNLPRLPVKGSSVEEEEEGQDEPDEYVDITPLPTPSAASPFAAVGPAKGDTRHSGYWSEMKFTTGGSPSGSARKVRPSGDSVFSSASTSPRLPEDDYEVMLPFGQGHSRSMGRTTMDDLTMNSRNSSPLRPISGGWQSESCLLDTSGSFSQHDYTNSATDEIERRSTPTIDEREMHDYADPDFVTEVRAGRELLSIRVEDYEDGVDNEVGYQAGVQLPVDILKKNETCARSKSETGRSPRLLRQLSERSTFSFQIAKPQDSPSTVHRRLSDPQSILLPTNPPSEGNTKKWKRPKYMFLSQTLGRPARKNTSSTSSPESQSLAGTPTSAAAGFRSRIATMSHDIVSRVSPNTKDSPTFSSPDSRLKRLREKRLRRYTTEVTDTNQPATEENPLTSSSPDMNTRKKAQAMITHSGVRSSPVPQQHQQYRSERELEEALLKSTLV